MKLAKSKLKQIIKEEFEHLKEDIMSGKIKPDFLKFLSSQSQKEWFNSPSIQKDMATKEEECARKNKCLDAESFECVECEKKEFDGRASEKSANTPAHMQGAQQ